MMKKIVKKSYNIYTGNIDYPTLKIQPTFQIEIDGRYRLLEQDGEYLEKSYGYETAPEMYKRRILQKNILGFWYNIHSYTYKIPSQQWIASAVFGEKQDYTNDWAKVRLLSIQQYLDTEPKYEIKIGKNSI
jgi:hypothetical protein